MEEKGLIFMDINNIENNDLKKFLVSLGSLTEIWMFTYNNCKKQGLNEEDALKHTKAFMEVFSSEMLNGSDGEKDE